MIAFSHPGKLGDALYCLPTIRYICAKLQTQADFYTSAYCLPLKRLLEYQSCIRKVIVPDDYVIENAYCGIQPWAMPVPENEYEHVYQLGFRTEPTKELPDFIADSVAIPTGLPLIYQYPRFHTLEEPYLVIAPGQQKQFWGLLREVIRRATIKSVIVGAQGEYLGEGIDMTGLDFLETTSWIASARAFLGTMSSQLVLANGFPIPKIVVHDGQTWDMRHVIQSPFHYYPVYPSAQEILSLLGIISYSKTLHPKDYSWIGETEHIGHVLQLLDGLPVRYEHNHRQWEYGIVLRALRENKTRTVLDVGGGGSAFAPTASSLGMEVLQVDPGPHHEWVFGQAQRLKIPMRYLVKNFFDFESKERFHAVTCLSVIEHVEQDEEFFLKLLRYVADGGLLAITTDFHPSGKALVKEHLRTYNEENLMKLANFARAQGFEFFGSKSHNRFDYTWHGTHVNSYNFASLIMRKKESK